MKGMDYNMGNYSVLDYVMIVANNEWHGLIGIITEIQHGYIHVKCVKRAAEHYIVGKDNIDDIQLYI